MIRIYHHPIYLSRGFLAFFEKSAKVVKEVRGLKIHVLHCGYIRVSDTVPFGNGIDLKNTGKQLLTPDKERITLPVCVYLAEHPKGLLLFDTG